LPHARISPPHKLSSATALHIAVRSLRARIGRSLLTLVTIVVAIAFLTNVWMNSQLEPPVHSASLAAQGLADQIPHKPPPRTGLLLTLSLLVCTVGISNAMLMSVMERFREIGTMKCLGAFASFILKLFLFESLLLGAAGSLAGVLIGWTLTLLLLLHQYGTLVWHAAPLAGTLWIALASLGIGVVITTLAAAYPAWRAARMDPIAAMRVDV